MNSRYYPVAFVLLVSIAVYIMYSDVLIPKVDLVKYKEVCIQYRDATSGVYSQDDIQVLVNQVNYLLPGNIAELNNSLEQEVKNCTTQLEKMLLEKRKQNAP